MLCRSLFTHSTSLLLFGSSLILTLMLTLKIILIGNPYNDSNIKGDPYRTLFVSNLVKRIIKITYSF